MPQSSQVGLTIRQKEPVNLETAVDQIDTFLTPADLFYVRSHFPAPDLKITGYELRVGGAVRQPFTLSYRSLREMPSETRTATLECAGNGRVFLVPAVQGAQWELGAVGTAEWTGVPLAALLERAGVDDDACEIVLEGADRGIAAEPPVPPGSISYARSLPLSKAMQGEVLIAYQMNGRDLRPDHGYPVRAIVPGHFGMASVKWLTRIEAVYEPFQGYWQTSDYGYWNASATGARGNAAQIRDLPAARVRNRSCEPGLPGFRRSVDGRVRGHRGRAEHRRRPDLNRGKIPGSRSTVCLAALGM
jgi:DMSO/TMAO reductase YedYZ molybdopterin-dependent catalytic subunit